MTASAWNGVSTIAGVTGSVQTVSISTFPFFKGIQRTFLQRVVNFLAHGFDQILTEYYYFPKIDKILSKQFKNLPPISELKRLSTVVLFNHNPVVEQPEQFLPNVIGVGGLQIQPAKPLPADLNDVLNNAPNGVILFALGTNIHFELIGDDRITIILKVFGRLSQYKFVCKADVETHRLPIELPSNVIIQKWVPQNDILGKCIYYNSNLPSIHHLNLSPQQYKTVHYTWWTTQLPRIYLARCSNAGSSSIY